MAYELNLNDLPEPSQEEQSFTSEPVIRGLLAGAGKLGQNIHNLPHNVATYLGNKGLISKNTTNYLPEPTNINMEETFGINNPTGYDKFYQMAGEIAPTLPLGGIGNLAKAPAFITHLARNLPKFGRAAAEIGGVGLKNAPAGAALNIVSSDNPENIGEQGIKGALMSALMGSLFKGAEKGYNYVRPSQVFRGNLSPEQLKENLEVSRGTETGLGDVIESPRLKQTLENVLSKVPFSGATDVMQRTAQTIKEKSGSILDKFLGKHNPEDVGMEISSTLEDVFKKQRTLKNEIFNEANEAANQAKLKLELPQFSETAKKYSEAIKDTNILKYEPETKSILNRLKNYKNGTGITLKEAGLLKGTLGEYANKLKNSPEINQRNAARVFGELATTLNKDISESLKRSGDEKLISAYKKAIDNYKENFAPLLDKDIYRYASGDKRADADLIVSSFVKSGKNDRGNLLSKLMNQLPKNKQDLIAYSHLSKAMEGAEVNPLKLKTIIKDLIRKPNQFKALIPDAAKRKELIQHAHLTGKNTEGLTAMFNPKTGHRVNDWLSHAVSAALASGGTALAGIPGAVAGAVLPMVGARALTKGLTSQKVRETFVKNMLNSNKKFKNPQQMLMLLNALANGRSS